MHNRLQLLGQRIFGAVVAALGAENIVCVHSGKDGVPVLPWLPRVAPLVFVVGALFIACGLALVLDRRVRPAALTLAAALLLAMLILQVPPVVAAPLDLSIRTGLLEELSFIGAAAMLVTGSSKLDGHLRIGGRLTFALASIVFGISHFLIPKFIASLIPAWMPFPLFLAWFTGFAMVAAGLSLLLGILAPLSSKLLAAMYFIIFTTLHLPRVLGAHRGDPDEWSSAFICFAMCGAALISGQLDERRSAVVGGRVPKGA